MVYGRNSETHRYVSHENDNKETLTKTLIDKNFCGYYVVFINGYSGVRAFSKNVLIFIF